MDAQRVLETREVDKIVQLAETLLTSKEQTVFNLVVKGVLRNVDVNVEKVGGRSRVFEVRPEDMTTIMEHQMATGVTLGALNALIASRGGENV